MSTSPPFPSATKTYHMATYPAISPRHPSLTQQGKNVLITGAGGDIGRAISLSFAAAQVSNIALLGRTASTLENTKSQISSTYPDVTTYVYICDITDESTVNDTLSAFAKAVDGPIHTLVANAGVQPGLGLAQSTTIEILQNGIQANLIGTANTIRAFLRHIPTTPDGTGYRARIIHTSSAVVHGNVPHMSSYSVAKLAAAKFVEFVALENTDVFCLSFHPGVLEGNMDDIASAYGVNLEPKDDISLPANFTVWAASQESAFLGSGRFVWAHWDVGEMKERFEEYTNGKAVDGREFLGGLRVNRTFTLGLTGWP